VIHANTRIRSDARSGEGRWARINHALQRLLAHHRREPLAAGCDARLQAMRTRFAAAHSG
jgi:hypothetical protein